MWNWIEKSAELEQSGEQFAIVTITQCKGSSPREVGAKMIVLPSGDFFGTIGGGNLEKIAISDALECLEKSKSKHLPYPLCFRTGQCCGGAVEVFIEIQGMQPRLYIFGAGHVGQAVAQVMVGTGFAIQMIDDRAEWIESPNIPRGYLRKKKTGWHLLKKVFLIVRTHMLW